MSDFMDSKEQTAVETQPWATQVTDEEGNKLHDVRDAKDMYRMGKEQKFKRIFRQSTMIMFTSILQATWEVVLLAPTSGLINGGLAGLFWSYVWTFIGFLFIVASLAEMSSMAPTSGGQYHWVSEFAPRKYQKPLSYYAGWLSTLSWLAGTAGGSFIFGVLIQSIIIAYRPSYVPKPWQQVLFVFADAFVQGTVNTIGAQQLPRFQKLMMFPHGLGWIPTIVVLAVLAPHASAKEVFTAFTSNGGWEPIGLSLMVGQITSVYFLICSDSAAHLAEEVHVAARSIPQAMIWSFFLNGTLGFAMLITFLFSIPDISAVLDLEQNPSGYPVIYVFQQASFYGCIPLLIILVCVIMAGTIDSNCSTSRQMFAFARDGGFPFKRFFMMQNKQGTPYACVLFCAVFCCILSLIVLGSSVAFNAIISLQLLALMTTYCISIGCVLYQRLANPDDLPPAMWSLGKYGLPINAVGFLYSFFTVLWIAWPAAKNPTRETFNWSSVMFAAVIIISTVFYMVSGRKTYSGPVVLVRKL